MQKFLPIAQLVVSGLLIITILLQQRGAGASAITGGASATYYKKRGIEKYLYWTSAVLAAIFVLLGIINLLK